MDMQAACALIQLARDDAAVEAFGDQKVLKLSPAADLQLPHEI